MSRYQQGKFQPRNSHKYAGNIQNIVYRSSWEKKFFTWCDLNESVIKWSSEEVVVPYVSPKDSRVHRYFVDVNVTLKKKDGSVKTYWVEIKPLAQTRPPKKRSRLTKRYIYEVNQYLINKAKWAAATTAARKYNAEFIIITEKNIGVSN